MFGWCSVADWKSVGGGEQGSGFGGADRCPRCGKSVYAAEKIVGAGSVSVPMLQVIMCSQVVIFSMCESSLQAWHKACFNCADCNKKLDSTTMCDNERQIYCKGWLSLI